MIVRSFALWLLMAALAGAQELPVKGGGGTLEKEAAQLIEGLPDLTEPPPTPRKGAPLTVAQAEARVAAARRKAERWDRLQRQGVVSRVEAENAALEVFQSASRCEAARLLQASQDLLALRAAAPGGAPEPARLAEAESAVEAARKKALAAQEAWNEASLRLARANLGRFRKLYADRLVTKAQVQRLEATIAALEAKAAASTPTAAPTTAP